MKKIIAIVLAVSSLFFLTVTKTLADWTAGVSVTGGVYEASGEDANVILGCVIDNKLEDEIRITVIATGLDNDEENKTNVRTKKKFFIKLLYKINKI